MTTDYIPGDEPVPPGTVVLYAYPDGPPKEYTVVDHDDPHNHPHPPPEPPLAEAYPDGVAYYLWPVGLPRKFGFRDQAIGWVRRTSFTVKPANGA